MEVSHGSNGVWQNVIVKLKGPIDHPDVNPTDLSGSGIDRRGPSILMQPFIGPTGGAHQLFS